MSLAREAAILPCEDGEEPARSDVLLQDKYIGDAPAIPSSLANTPCSDLGVPGLLENLNNILGRTTRTIKSTARIDASSIQTPITKAPADPDTLTTLLSTFIRSNDHTVVDFGTAYAYLRPPPSEINTGISACRDEDRAIRDKALSRSSHLTGLRVDSPDTVPPLGQDSHVVRFQLFANHELRVHAAVPPTLNCHAACAGYVRQFRL